MGSACTIVSGIIATIFLGSCSTSPDDLRASHSEYQSDVATVMVTPEPLIPWSKVKAGLQPGFTTGGETMLSKVAPDTLTSEQKSYDEHGTAIAAGLPTAVDSQVLTKGITNGTQSTTYSDTTTKASGSPPSSTPALPGKGASGLPPATSILSGARSLDPMLQYTAATALNEEVALLNQYLAELETDTSDHYVAYVLRLHITVAPKLRDLPYDGYIDVSLLPGDTNITAAASNETPKQNQTPHRQTMPKLLPLLASESLESVLQSNSAENVRELALALQGTIEAVGINASTQAVRDKLATIIGRDLNSTLLVGRIADDTIRIRIGAMAQSIAGNISARYSLVPVSHNITTIVLVPRDFDLSNGLVVATRTLFRDAITGATLPDDPTLRLIYRYDIGWLLNNYPTRYLYPDFVYDKDEHKNFLKLAHRAQLGLWTSFSTTMSSLLNGDPDLSYKEALAWHILRDEKQVPYGAKNVFNSNPDHERKISMILDPKKTNLSEDDFENLLQPYTAGNFTAFRDQLKLLAGKNGFLISHWAVECDNLAYLVWARLGDYVANSRIGVASIDFGNNKPLDLNPTPGSKGTLPPNDQTVFFKADPDDANTLTTTLVGGKGLDTLADLGATLHYVPSAADGKGAEMSYAKSVITSSDGTQVTLTFQIDGARADANDSFLQDPNSILTLVCQMPSEKANGAKYIHLTAFPKDNSEKDGNSPVVLSTSTDQIARLPDGTAELLLKADVKPPKPGNSPTTYTLSIVGANVTQATLDGTNLGPGAPLNFSTSLTFDLHLKNTSSEEKIVCTARDSSKKTVSSLSIAVTSR